MTAIALTPKLAALLNQRQGKSPQRISMDIRSIKVLVLAASAAALQGCAAHEMFIQLSADIKGDQIAWLLGSALLGAVLVARYRGP